MKNKAQIKDIYTLTPMQEGMLYHALRDPSSAVYLEQTSYLLTGHLDVDAVKKSLDELMKRYDVLRTIFILEGSDRPIQVVLEERRADFYYEDAVECVTREGADLETYVEAFKEKDRKRVFDLSRDVLMRVSVLKTAENGFLFIWTHHHIIMDGWCVAILTEDFWEIYQGFLEGRAYRLPEAVPFSIYISWLEKQDRKASRSYWRHYLDGYSDGVTIPDPDGVIDAEKTGDYQPRVFSWTLDKENTAALNRMAAGCKVTLNHVVQAIWGIALGRYNRREDVVFGVVVSGRPEEIPGVETVVGLFINTIPVRVRWEDTKTFRELVQNIRQGAVESKPHHYSPLAEIQSDSILKQRLINHIMVFENFPMQVRLDGALAERHKNSQNKTGGFSVSGIDVFDFTNYDLNINVVPGDTLTLRFQFNGNAYAPESIARIAGHLELLFRQVIDDENMPVSGLTLVPEEEILQLMSFNHLQEDFSNDERTTIHGWFEEQVEKTPESPAIHHNGMELSYRELNRKINRLARVLRNKGVQRDCIVGLMTERSIGMVIAMIAVMKAGGAYMAVDSEYPGDRKKYMLENAGVSILLTYTGESAADFLPPSVEVVDLHRERLFTEGDDSNPGPINSTGDLAYVIYTSGSTGKPKGVMLEHRNLVNLMRHQFKHTSMDTTKILQFSTINFDAAFHEIFSALLSGGTIYVIDKDIRLDIPRLFRLVKENGIKTVFLPMSFLKVVFSEEEYIKMIPSSLTHIQTAGERVVVSRRFRQFLKESGVQLHNHYGPAETHVITTFTVNPRQHDIPELPSIGSPTLNTGIYMVDKYDRLVPVGVPGELLAGGAQVGRGYLGREDLTAERFVPNPFVPGDTVYRTGDLARWRPDGNIDFLGRIDMQVKIRGFRIEPGEVESQLLNHPKVKEAVVNIGENEAKDKFLCAYFVADETLTSTVLRQYMAGQLPDYMIPDYFIQMEAIPLLPNRKVDYRALPDPKKNAGSGVPYEPPANETEELIIAAWADILELDPKKISRSDDFFAIGGNSINILRVLGRLKKSIKQDISMSSLFLYKKVSDLAANIHRESLLNRLECIVRLNHGNNDRNIFIVHPAHGMVYQYKELAKCLEKDFNVYGIQARGLLGGTPPPSCYRTMVTDYVRQVKQVQPAGPYFIGAFCFGDMIGFDMIRLLEDMNEKVEKYIMLDEHLFLPKIVLTYHRVRDRLLWPFRPFTRSKQYRRTMEEYQRTVERIHAEDGRREKNAAEAADQSGTTVEMQKTAVEESLKILMNDYFKVPVSRMIRGIIRADIIDIKAEEENPEDKGMNLDYSPEALGRLTYGTFELLHCTGGHDTIFEKPHVERLAEIIRNHV